MTVASPSSKSVEQVQSVDAIQVSENPALYDVPLATIVASQQQPVKFTGAPMGTTATPYPEPMRNSSKAIASLVCAIVGLFFFGIILGPVAICLAVAALNEINEQPDRVTGKCLATSGLIIGIIGFIGSIIIIIMWSSSSTY
jgi:hypothetical protein